MWRKALVLGLVLMAVGMVVSGAVEEKAEIGIAYGAYRWHKTGRFSEFVKGYFGWTDAALKHVTMGGGFLAASKVFRRASKFTKFCRFAGKGFLVLAVIDTA